MLTPKPTRFAVALALISALSMAFAPCALAWEVNTHQAITQQALRDVPNLDLFLRDLGLTSARFRVDHQGSIFRQELRDAFPGSILGNADARSIISGSAVLEDDNCQGILAVIAAAFTDASARCFRHFYDPVHNTGLAWFPHAKEWGRNHADNIWSWEEAYDYYREGMTRADRVERNRFQLSMLRALGQVAHLLQDMMQPSHVRDDPHPIVTAFEEWGAANVTPQRIHSEIALAIANLSSHAPASTYDAYFQDASTFSNSEFFSDDTIFDSNYPLPSGATTSTAMQGSDLFITNPGISHLFSHQDVFIAREYESMFCTPHVCVPITKHSLFDREDLVVRHALSVLIPGAVSYTRGLINYFFRGRLQVSLNDADPTILEITNNSNTALFPAFELAFSGGSVRLFYEAEDGTLVELDGSGGTPNVSPVPISLLGVGGSVQVPGNIPGFLEQQADPMITNPSVRARSDRRLLAFYEGNIGSDIGSAAGRATFVNDISLLLSFDTSGSISTTELQQAKDAALTLLQIMQSGGGNRVSLHRFASSAAIVEPFTSNLAQVETSILALTDGGSTALHDAVVLAGNEAVLEATGAGTGAPRRTFVVLFTDGVRNASISSQADAAHAISVANAPEIEEVFLVSVGGSAFGDQQLSDLAAQAGRHFFAITEFSQLTDILLNAIQSAP